MIASLKGILEEKRPSEVVIDVGGVGYHAHIPLSTFYTLPDVGARVELWTVTNLRENALELFAFADRRERALFTLLRSVSGIGPRLALTILSGIEAEELAEVLECGRSDRLVVIPGVGRKTADRVVLELKDKVDRNTATEGAGASSLERDAVTALVGLGYKQRDASDAVRVIRKSGELTVEGLIKRSLARLS